MANPFEQAVAAPFVVLDTETTGLGSDAEIVSIGIVDSDGTVLVDSLIKPQQPIPADATRIHGITDADVAEAPTWPEIRDKVMAAIEGKTLVIYNAGYDTRILTAVDKRHSFEGTDWSVRAACAMEWYAEVFGDWNDYRQSFRWQKLTNAMQQQGLPVVDAHHALGDAQMTLALISKLIPSHYKDAAHDQ